jgi:hypothetical protein
MNLNKKQQGIALPISLFVLIGVLLAALLLIRSSDVSVIVSGNVGIKAQLAGSNDQAISTAFKWLQDNKASLNNDNFANGYFSSHPIGFIDYTNKDNWVTAKKLAKDDMGNISSYKIIRMCAIPNAARNETVNGVNNVCYTDSGNSAVTSDTSSVGYGAYQYTQPPASLPILYKIVVKTEGPKSAETVTETVVSF